MLAGSDALEDGEIGSLPIPDSLQALIGSRLDALAAADKRVAQQASVVGAVFWLGAVAHLAGSNSDLGVRWRRSSAGTSSSARPESRIAGDREFEFKHILIRDVAYERLPKGRRAELHVLFSEWLNGATGRRGRLRRGPRVPPGAGVPARAGGRAQPRSSPRSWRLRRRSRRAGEKAERRGGMREADRYFARALELLDDPLLDTMRSSCGCAGRTRRTCSARSTAPRRS